MAKQKKHHSDDQQESFEHFLDSIDDDVAFYQDESSNAPLSNKSPLGVVIAKASLFTAVVVSLLLWFIWPSMTNNISHDERVYDGHDRLNPHQLNQLSQRLDALEQKLIHHDKLQSYDLARVKKTNEYAKEAAQRKAEIAQAAKKKAESIKQALRKAEKAQAAKKKAEELKLLQKKNKQEANDGRVNASEAARSVVTTEQHISSKSSEFKPQVKIPKTLAAAARQHPTVVLAGQRYEVYQVSVNVANVRSAPTSNALVVAKLKQGTKVIVLKHVGDWIQIRIPHKKPGWVYDSLVQ